MQLLSLIGIKTYQKQGFLQDGTRVPLSGVLVAGNFVTQIKNKDKEGYNALQFGISNKKKTNKTLENHSKKAGLKHTPRFFREIRVDDVEGAVLGSEINVSEVFTPGDLVDVTGVSKGKGFAGGVKRHHFKGGPRTHGQSDRERAPGSIGQTTTPGRVYKGKRMAGRMGHDTVTVKNLEIIDITNDGVLMVKGLIPGGLNSLVRVKKAGTNKKFQPLYSEVPEASEKTVEAKVEVESAQPVSETVVEDEVPKTQPVEAVAEVESAQPVEETSTQEDSKTDDLNVQKEAKGEPK